MAPVSASGRRRNDDRDRYDERIMQYGGMSLKPRSIPEICSWSLPPAPECGSGCDTNEPGEAVFALVAARTVKGVSDGKRAGKPMIANPFIFGLYF